MLHAINAGPAPRVAGSTASNPIVIADDCNAGSSANEPIVVADDEDNTSTMIYQVTREGDTPRRTHLQVATGSVMGGTDERNDSRHSNYAVPSIPRQPRYFQYRAAQWPSTVRRLERCLNPDLVEFPDVDYGTCNCIQACAVESCVNAGSAVYCGPMNCRVGAHCGNRLHECKSLELIWCSKGYGVLTTATLPSRTVIGEYSGVIVTSSSLTRLQIANGFVLGFKSSSSEGEPVFIDAHSGGGICPFVNHSCKPNARFEERSNRTARKMVVVTHATLKRGEELTVKYDDQVAFPCLCNAGNCVQKTKTNM